MLKLTIIGVLSILLTACAGPFGGPHGGGRMLTLHYDGMINEGCPGDEFCTPEMIQREYHL